MRLVCVSAALVFVVSAGAALLVVHRADDRADRAEAILAATRQFTMTLLDLDFTKPGAALERLKSQSTGELAEQLTQVDADFQQKLGTARVSSRGASVTVGIVSATDNEATALISARAVVSNAQTSAPQGRGFRWEVGLQRADAGWLVSHMEFVP
jgi:multidrug efflux pump subunit AcrA (membrane-fusion protein)